MSAHDEEIAALRALVDAQQHELDRLRARLDGLEQTSALPVADRAADPGGGIEPDVEPATIAASGRRQLLMGLAAGAAATGAAVLGTSSPAAAASGTFDGNPAVVGTTNAVNGTAIRGIGGTGSGGNGVYGSTQNGGVGVRGNSAFATGVLGTGSTGVHGEGDSRGVFAKSVTGTALALYSERCHLRFERPPTGLPLPPLARAADAGEVVFDHAGDLWLCITIGTPGVWRRLGGTSTAGALTVLPSAVRAYDSRAGQVPTGVAKGQLASGQERTVDLRVGSGVPAGATAALLNVTVTGTSAGGFLKLFKPGAAVPSASAINWVAAGSNLANHATVAVSPTAGVTVRCGGSGAVTDVIIDVMGYYR